MLKIYRNKEMSSEKITHIVISNGIDDTTIIGCLVYSKDDDYKGFSDQWNMDFFRELELGEEIELNLSRSEFINGKIFIKGKKYKDCIIDLNENTIERFKYDDNQHKVKLRFKKTK